MKLDLICNTLQAPKIPRAVSDVDILTLPHKHSSYLSSYEAGTPGNQSSHSSTITRSAK